MVWRDDVFNSLDGAVVVMVVLLSVVVVVFVVLLEFVVLLLLVVVLLRLLLLLLLLLERLSRVDVSCVSSMAWNALIFLIQYNIVSTVELSWYHVAVSSSRRVCLKTVGTLRD